MRIISSTSIALAVGALTLSGCAAVGPDYARPELPLSPAYANAPRALAPDDLARWWERFGDPGLTRLVEVAVVDNLDVQQATERIAEARALRRVARSAFLPSVGIGAGVTRSRTPGGELTDARTSTLYEAGFDASWELDVFGRTRRSVEAAQATIDSTEDDRRDVLVTLVAEVARNYVELRGSQARLAYARANLTTQQETLRITRARLRAGAVSDLDVQRALAQSENTGALIPALEQAERAAIHRIGVLLGREPAAVAADLLRPAALPRVSLIVDGGAPADLLRRRPDVRFAERRLAVETAEIGIATADLYPTFSLSGAIGALFSSFSGLSLDRALSWSAGAAVDQIAFDGGGRRGRVEAERAQARAAALAYRSAVLLAFEEVENGFVGYAAEQRRRDRLTASVTSYARAADLSRRLYRVGETDFLTVLDAERELVTAQDALAASETTVGTNLVTLFKALGGGWDSIPVQQALLEAAP